MGIQEMITLENLGANTKWNIKKVVPLLVGIYLLFTDKFVFMTKPWFPNSVYLIDKIAPIHILIYLIIIISYWAWKRII